ncbi:hypothetical protein N431DRAFT_396985 [Stipitochalara longipes BDJ]|nr:hypothetical protein N431DRAFT_396985 [Stipitochalara longipes BDJ]
MAEGAASPNGSRNANQANRTAPGRFQCLECQQTFGRVEHLTRHSRSHLKERFLKCSYCRKGFYRIDALRRHEQVHSEPKRSVLGKGYRACLACAAARRKCSGGIPCLGCQKRTVDCKYPESGRSRRATSAQVAGGDSTSPVNDHGTPSGSEQSSSKAQESPMSWSNTSASPQMNQDHDHAHIAAADSLPGTTNANTFLYQSHPSTEYALSFVRNNVQLQTAMSPGLSGVHNSQPLPSPISRSEPQNLEIPPSSEPMQSFMERQPNVRSLEMNTGAGTVQNQHDNGEPESWYQSNFSSINWLPDNWTPEFQIDNNLGPFDQQSLFFGQTPQASNLTYPLGNPSQNQTPRQVFRPRESIRRQSQAIDGPDVSSPSTQSTHSGGHFYVDGDGARLPRVRKIPYRYSDSYAHTSTFGSDEHILAFKFPEIGDVPEVAETKQISQNTYSEISESFTNTCISTTHFSNFYDGAFPSRQVLSLCVLLYMDNFDSILPFIHPATLDISSSHWLLLLAMAAAGSHYLDTEHSEAFSIAMHEFLRRAIAAMAEAGKHSRPSKLVLTQIKLLNCVGMIYCGDERLSTMAEAYHGDLVSFCSTEWSRTLSEVEQSNINGADDVDYGWKRWHEAESRRRTGYCIWWLDCMWAFHFQRRPLLSLDDARVPIPCQEVLWEAQTALDWQQLYSCAEPSPSLHAAVQLAYIEKRIQSSTGEFSRILCIHALFRRTWEVEAYFKQPLTLWTPTAEKQDIKTISRSMPVWLPGIQTYSKWRNSACDCLDILHWHANSVIGAASGMEHPTVLHLHLARVILLTPFRQIVQLAYLLTNEPLPATEEDLDIPSLRKHIQRWALEDQHKARLAMIHAGVLFWHVRRFSADAFYEPSSVFLATLALWAYGTFAARTSPLPQPQPDSQSPQAANKDDDDDAESLFPTSMQLDRPADDELVQLFVKRGASMRANITGVGNLCSAKGPVRVLVEGRNLLAGLKTWGERKRGIRVLSALIEVCRQEGAGTGVGS